MTPTCILIPFSSHKPVPLRSCSTRKRLALDDGEMGGLEMEGVSGSVALRSDSRDLHACLRWYGASDGDGHLIYGSLRACPVD
jgi:hypothetical protein